MRLKSSRTLLWTNVALFQAAWFLIVLSAASGMTWIAPIVTVALLAWHVHHAQQPRRELWLIGIAAAFGAAFESAIAALDVIAPASGTFGAGLVAYWLVCLWAAFATTLNVSLRWLRPRPLLAAAIGAIGGPLAYAGGAELGALRLDASHFSLGALALGWALATPLLLLAAKRFDGYAGS